MSSRLHQLAIGSDLFSFYTQCLSGIYCNTMYLEEKKPTTTVSITYYDHEGFECAGSYHKGVYLISNHRVIAVNETNPLEALKKISATPGSLLIIGSNKNCTSQSLHEWTVFCVEQRCHFEWMPYAAACCLINLLQEEGRSFACLLVPPNFPLETLCN